MDYGLVDMLEDEGVFDGFGFHVEDHGFDHEYGFQSVPVVVPFEDSLEVTTLWEDDDPPSTGEVFKASVVVNISGSRGRVEFECRVHDVTSVEEGFNIKVLVTPL